MKFLLQTQIGVENITEVELMDKFKGKFSIDSVGFVPHKNGLVQLDWRSEENLDFYKSLGTVEDAFFVLDYVKDLNGELNLRDITKKLNVNAMKKSLDFFFDKLNDFDNSRKFRFVTRKKAPHDFRRKDLDDEMKRFFERYISRVDVTSEEGTKEIWTTMVKNRLVVCVRLTTKEKRHSAYKVERVHGSLRPTVAFAMNYLSEVKSKDTVWDPFCGAGTIGCELVENSNFKKLILSDISEEAINATKANLNATQNYKKLKGKVSIRHEDFFDSKNYSDLVITNLPFGVQYAVDSDFMLNFFKKLTEIESLRQITLLFPDLIDAPGWQLTRKFELQVLGRACNLGVYRRVDSKG
jgi:tRNA G10  N-methylase Trm11